MQIRNIMLALAVVLWPLGNASAQQGGIRPAQLTCEYQAQPLGIDIQKPRLSWTLTGTGRNLRQTAYEIIVSSSAGNARALKGDVWQSGKITSSENIHITFNGAALQSFTRYWWRVKVYDANDKASAWSAPQWFETAMLQSGEWVGEWIGDGSPQFEKPEDFYKDDPMPLFRKTFLPAKKVTAARLYISGVGYYEAYLNGKKISDHVLDPGWTSYDKRVLYAVHDIAALMQPGQNTAGIMVGNGWYNPLPLQLWGARNWRDFLPTGRPCVKAMIRLTYADGTTEAITTDNSWQTAPGPVIRNNVYLGEHYDARKEVKNWAAANPTGSWKDAVPVTGPNGILQAQQQPPIRVTKVLQPRSIREVKPGVYLLDMGQNFAGVVRIHVQGPAGRQVVLRFGEDTLKNGEINVMTSVAGQIKNNNGGPGAPPVAWQEDRYTLKGAGRETWSPRFTYHGFRYVEVTGWPGKPAIGDIVGLRMNADLQPGGHFTSSNAMFNRLDENIQWTFLSNVFSVQSDCPAREKTGLPGRYFLQRGRVHTSLSNAAVLHKNRPRHRRCATRAGRHHRNRALRRDQRRQSRG
ncbi:family 78 glycoside hydrolase catalytic domain [Chitinophaga pollutisoli]|uniref:family 78 glycoside hydrolase catalytic domain n=1 Tax=Chitinophaga pollutisoli TaxID=3133966 RepID=UPI003857D0BA